MPVCDHLVDVCEDSFALETGKERLRFRTRMVNRDVGHLLLCRLMRLIPVFYFEELFIVEGIDGLLFFEFLLQEIFQI